MNPKINKAIDEIERTKAKIAELQALLPELERKRTDLENTEVVRLMRSANVAPGDIAAFIESIKTGQDAGVSKTQSVRPAWPDSRTQDGKQPRAEFSPASKTAPEIRPESGEFQDGRVRALHAVPADASGAPPPQKINQKEEESDNGEA